MDLNCNPPAGPTPCHRKENIDKAERGRGGGWRGASLFNLQALRLSAANNLVLHMAPQFLFHSHAKCKGIQQNS